ncbi:hypothetical protein CGZ97_13595 [Enemella evansiae]|nr:hypothetical protein CGZ97_13595 [Enemella evansiae]
MRLARVAGICHRPKGRHRPAAAVHDDLVHRKFVADAPDRLWCAPTSPNIPPATARSIAARCWMSSVAWWWAGRSPITCAPSWSSTPWEMAMWRRHPQGTIVHSDRGAQYTSWVFGHRLRDAGLLGSMGRVASSVDNSMIESFWSTMQRELLDQHRWASVAELGAAIFEWIEAWYNPRRRHTSLDMLAPDEYETLHKITAPAA